MGWAAFLLLFFNFHRFEVETLNLRWFEIGHLRLQGILWMGVTVIIVWVAYRSARSTSVVSSAMLFGGLLVVVPGLAT